MKHFPRLCVSSILCGVALAGMSLLDCALSAEKKAPDTSALKMPQALAAAGFKKFAASIEASGLVETLEAEGPFTCFAPSDEAIAAMPEDWLNLIEKNPKDKSVIRWIQYHFVTGMALDRDQLMKVPGAHTLGKQYLRIWVTPGKIAINRTAPISRFDIRTANGIIHQIEGALEPDLDERPAPAPSSR
jgi:uncharacterized surface protein with fasciclin (FAS1) repeats